MNRNSQWYSILQKIDECQKDIEYLLNQNPNIPLIEVDIVLNKLSVLYDALMSIKLQAASNEENGFLTKNSSIITKIIKESVFSPEILKEEKTATDSPVPENSTSQLSDIVFKYDDVKEVSKKQENFNDKAEPIVQEERKQKMTIAESLSKPKKTIADLMEEINRKKDFATSQQYKSISDIKRAISINDKIMFIRELFNNNVENYNYVIEQVNSAANLDEALAILDKNVKIESDNVALTTLLELVYRRFLQQ